jgi:hypothetical protein
MDGPIWTFFAEDHRRLDALLESAVAEPGDIEGSAFDAFRAGLLKHIAVEEKILMPAIRQARGGEHIDHARRLRVDHGAIALLLVPSPTHALIAEVRSILGPHNLLEEADDRLYAAGDALLGGQVEELLAKARAYPNVKVMPHFDGPGVCRLASDALAISGKQAWPCPISSAPKGSH